MYSGGRVPASKYRDSTPRDSTEKEVPERDPGGLRQREEYPPVLWRGVQVLDDPVEVVAPVRHAGEERVPHQVVHAIGVELSAHHRAQQRRPVEPSLDERRAAG